MNRTRLRAGATIILACMQVRSLSAQELTIPEVIVTAERKSTLARTTPVSVGVIDRAEIDRKGISDLHDIVGVVAGVTVPNGFSNMPQAVAIRGVGASLPAMSQAVGIYLDDVPLLRGYATALWDLPDIERIEVLRGPQGTLYGQNSSAGAVRFITRAPQAQTTAWAAVAAGNEGTAEARAYVTGRLGETALLGSIAASRRTNEGFGYNAVKKKSINKLDVTQFQAKILVPFSDNLEAVFSLDGLEDRSDANTTNYPLNHAGAAPRTSYTGWDAGAFLRDAGGASLRLNWKLPSGDTVRSISAIRRFRDNPTVTDFGGLEAQRFGLSQKVAQTALTQEFQLQGHAGRWGYTTGLMLVRDEFKFDRWSAITPLFAPTNHSLANTRLTTTDAGVYGQLRYDWTESTGFSLGAREYYTHQTGSNRFSKATPTGEAQSLIYLADNLDASTNGFLPRVGFDHRFNEDIYLYASLANGAKFGGYNRAAESLVSAQVATRPEKVRTWEAGTKLKGAKSKATANFAVFYNDYRDYLASLANTRINGVQVNDQVLMNAGKAKTYGTDVELVYQADAGTKLTLSIEALRSRFRQFQATAYVGNELPNAPKLSAGSSIVHRIPAANGGIMELEVSGQYLRRHFSDAANTPSLAFPSQVYFNSNISWHSPLRNWTISLRAKNLANKSYPLLRTIIPPLGIDASYYNPPRTWLLSARRDW